MNKSSERKVPKYVTDFQLAELLGCSIIQVILLTRTQGFPKSHQIEGKGSFYLVTEIFEWIDIQRNSEGGW